MPVKHLPKEAHTFKDEWVALSFDETRVVGHGRTPDEALAQALAAGERDSILIYIPAVWPETMIV